MFLKTLIRLIRYNIKAISIYWLGAFAAYLITLLPYHMIIRLFTGIAIGLFVIVPVTLISITINTNKREKKRKEFLNK